MTDEEKKIVTRYGFGVRAEFEDCDSSDDYIKGYIKGILSALTDLNYPTDVKIKVEENLNNYRNWMKSDVTNLEEFLSLQQGEK